MECQLNCLGVDDVVMRADTYQNQSINRQWGTDCGECFIFVGLHQLHGNSMQLIKDYKARFHSEFRFRVYQF